MSSDPRPSALSLIPLGGSGVFGMNCNLYAHADALLMVDCGVSFLRVPGGENQITMPDPAWISRRREKLVGLVLTHGHEDHIGAVAAMWPQLRCPLFATPFTAHLLRLKLARAGLASVAQIVEVEVAPGKLVRLVDLNSPRLLPLLATLGQLFAQPLRAAAKGIPQQGGLNLHDPIVVEL